MRQLGDVARQLETLRAEREEAERQLLEERDRLARSLRSRGASVAEIAARARVSDSLMSRRLHQRERKPWPPRPRPPADDASPRP
jgi:hypothetical protein